MFPFLSCSSTSSESAFNFCLLSGHCSTQIGLLDFQFNLWVGRSSVAATEKPGERWVDQFWLPTGLKRLSPTGVPYNLKQMGGLKLIAHLAP